MYGSESDQESQSGSNREGTKEDQINTKDPFALDPCFNTEEDLNAYLVSIGQQDVIVTRDNIEVDVGELAGTVKRHCDCGNCERGGEDLKVSEKQDYLCCNQRFPNWKVDLSDTESTSSCVTKSAAYNASVNVYAVRGLLSSLKENPKSRVKISNPPSTENLRYGSYRAAAYLLNLTERKPLSACIVADIRSTYPDVAERYRGYSDR